MEPPPTHLTQPQPPPTLRRHAHAARSSLVLPHAAHPCRKRTLPGHPPALRRSNTWRIGRRKTRPSLLPSCDGWRSYALKEAACSLPMPCLVDWTEVARPPLLPSCGPLLHSCEDWTDEAPPTEGRDEAAAIEEVTREVRYFFPSTPILSRWWNSWGLVRLPGRTVSTLCLY